MKIVRAYSGSLNTSVFVSWVKEHYNAEIITYAADVGQEEEFNGLAEKATATGASAYYTVGLVGEFARDFIFPMLRGKVSFKKGQVLTVQNQISKQTKRLNRAVLLALGNKTRQTKQTSKATL
jgi:argininosuccinate synthase